MLKEMEEYNLIKKLNMQKFQIIKSKENEIKVKKLDEYDRDLKKSKDYSTFYCTHNFETMRKHRYKKWDFGLWRYEEFAHYFIDEMELPPKLQFNKRIIKRSAKNRILYIIFRLLNAFFLFTFARWFHNLLDYEESSEMIEKIKVLQFEYSQDKQSFEFYTKFQEKELFKEQGLHAWIKHPKQKLKSLVLTNLDDKEVEIFSEKLEKDIKLTEGLAEKMKVLENLVPKGPNKKLSGPELKEFEVSEKDWSIVKENREKLRAEYKINEVI